MSDKITNVIDCSGLLKISKTTSNALRSTAITMLQSGDIHVPTSVWDEFSTAYEEEADELERHVLHKIRHKASYRIATAGIADAANSGFRLEPYDRSDWTAAAIAQVEEANLLTDGDNVSFYSGICSATILDIESIVP